jgi:hypothetical protein
MFNWFKKVVKDYVVEDANTSLFDKITDLELRVLTLEAENVELTNCLYEVENRLQANIDNIHPVVYNLKNDNWDQ